MKGLTINSRTIAAAALLLVATTSLYAALNRFIARDEGYYLYAARLLQSGIMPYRDFFFPQTPLSPMIYSAWFDLVGTGWYEARIFAALLTTLAGFLMYVLAKHIYSSSAALLSLILFAVTVGVLAWLPTAQTNSLSITLLFTSLISIRICNNPFLAGAFFGFCIASRLTLAPIGIVLLLEVIRGGSSKEALERIWRFFLGLLVPLLSISSIAMLDVENFFEHNFQYHLERTGMSERQIVATRWRVLLALLGIREGNGLGELQFQLVLYAVVIGAAVSVAKFVYSVRSHQMKLLWNDAITRLDPFLLCAVIFFFVHLLPEPTYLQYFCLLQILLLPPAAHNFLKWIHSKRLRLLAHAPVLTCSLLCIAYSLMGFPDLHRFLYTGDGVIGVGRINREAWRLNTVKQVSTKIDSLIADDEFVLSSWPGYCVETRSYIIPGLESNFGPQWARNGMLSNDEQKRRKILSWERAIKRFTKDRATLAVLFLGVGRSNNLEKDIKSVGGAKIASLVGISFYKKPV